jgi:hypothetical protein
MLKIIQVSRYFDILLAYDPAVVAMKTSKAVLQLTTNNKRFKMLRNMESDCY